MILLAQPHKLRPKIIRRFDQWKRIGAHVLGNGFQAILGAQNNRVGECRGKACLAGACIAADRNNWGGVINSW